MIFINLDSFQVPSGRKKRRKRAGEKRVSMNMRLKKKTEFQSFRVRKFIWKKTTFQKKVNIKQNVIYYISMYYRVNLIGHNDD